MFLLPSLGFASYLIRHPALPRPALAVPKRLSHPGNSPRPAQVWFVLGPCVGSYCLPRFPPTLVWPQVEGTTPESGPDYTSCSSLTVCILYCFVRSRWLLPASIALLTWFPNPFVREGFSYSPTSSGYKPSSPKHPRRPRFYVGLLRYVPYHTAVAYPRSECPRVLRAMRQIYGRAQTFFCHERVKTREYEDSC